MPGLTTPIVKTEVAEGEEEAVDYGAPDGEAPKPEGGPTRAMPDYADLVDDDEPTLVKGSIKVKQTKEEDSKGDDAAARKDAIHVAGVQRLTRTHLEEIFQSKVLPMFRFIEWLSDDQVICVFEKVADAAIALRGCLAGFSEVEANDRPGPGLWRAQRFMLDFRQGTQADRPDVDFKKQHRGGRQVREYRFWEAIKDVDRNILGDDDSEGGQGVKRALPSGEDAMAAADWDDDGQRRKRLRRGVRPDVAEEDIDLLNMMASQDKTILTKEEAGEGTSLPTTNDGPVADAEESEQRSASKKDQKWWGGEGSDWGDDSWSWSESWGTPRWPKQNGRGEDQGKGWDKKRQRDEGGAAKTKGSEDGNFQLPMDDAESAKRSRRADRFKTPESSTIAKQET